jgi:hypothetical protein
MSKKKRRIFGDIQEAKGGCRMQRLTYKFLEDRKLRMVVGI